MRILSLTPIYLPTTGGAQYGLYELYRRFARRHDLQVVTPEPDGGMESHPITDAYYHDPGIRVHRFRKELLPAGPIGSRLNGLWRQAAFAAATSRLALRFRPDVIHANYLKATAVAAMASSRVSSAPVVTSLIGRPDILREENPEFCSHRKWFDRAIANSARVVSLTPYVAGGYAADPKFAYIPYGFNPWRPVDGRELDDLRRALDLPPDAQVMITLSRVDPIKRIDFIITSIAGILRGNPRAHFLILGDGSHKESLQRLVARAGLERQVHFAGYVEEQKLAAYFALASLFLFASDSETFGIVLAQAMAAGLPVVSVATTCIPDVIVDGRNGLLVQRNDARGYADAVARLMEDRTLAASMSRQNREEASTRYSWDEIFRRYEQLFEEVVSQRKAGPS